MDSSTTRQLWMISDLLKGFKRGGYSVAKLRTMFPTKDEANKAIRSLLDIERQEAERINKLPVEMRLIAHKELSDEDWQLIKDGQYESRNN